MPEKRIENLNIKVEEPLITPDYLKELFPLTEKAITTVMNGQKTIKDILDDKDHRLFCIVGPCSIHDAEAAKEYAQKLKELSDKVNDTLFLIMRFYFEKPRTTTGWQGLIIDPFMDNSFKIEEGLKIARSLLLYVCELGLPAAGEALDIVTPQYVQDLISWTAIGARTTESQSHRKMASGFTSAVGFKNGTDGSIDIALNAITTASHPNNFISVDPFGKVAVIRTTGNRYCHIILRGGKEPNYYKEHVKKCENQIAKLGFKPNIMIDCSHANSNKDAARQPKVLEDITSQIIDGNKSIKGIMLESNVNFGSQKIPNNLKDLKYGVSITDACIDWQTTEEILLDLRTKLIKILPQRIK